MNIIQKFWSSLFSTAPPNQQLQVQYVNGQLVLYKTGSDSYINDGYLTNGQVYAVIGWILRKAAVAPWYVYEVVDEKAYKQYKAITSDNMTPAALFNAQMLQAKALKPIEDSKNPMQKILDRPNEQMSFAEFIQFIVGFRLILGESFTYKISGVGDVPIEIYPMHPQDTELIMGKNYLSVDGYVWTGGNTRQTLTKEQVTHTKYFNPIHSTNGDNLRGLSPLAAMLRVIQESNEYGLQAIKQAQNSGPAHLISSASTAANQMGFEDGTKLKDALKTKWKESSREPFVTSAAIDVHALGLSPADLKLIDGRMFTFRSFCDGYGIPSEIFNDPQNKTYANKNEAKRAGILDGVEPELRAVRDIINNSFPANKGKKFVVDYDISMLPEMQEDQEKMAAALEKQPYATWAEKRKVMKWGDDVRPEYATLLNDYMIPSGLTPSTYLADSLASQEVVNDGSI